MPSTSISSDNHFRNSFDLGRNRRVAESEFGGWKSGYRISGAGRETYSVGPFLCLGLRAYPIPEKGRSRTVVNPCASYRTKMTATSAATTDGPALPPSKYLCLTILGYRKPGMSEEAYRRHMNEVSAPLTKDLMVKYGVKRWTVVRSFQNFRVEHHAGLKLPFRSTIRLRPAC